MLRMVYWLIAVAVFVFIALAFESIISDVYSESFLESCSERDIKFIMLSGSMMFAICWLPMVAIILIWVCGNTSKEV